MIQFMDFFRLANNISLLNAKIKVWKYTKTYKSDYTSEETIKNRAGEFSIVYNLVIFFGKLYHVLILLLKINLKEVENNQYLKYLTII